MRPGLVGGAPPRPQDAQRCAQAAGICGVFRPLEVDAPPPYGPSPFPLFAGLWFSCLPPPPPFECAGDRPHIAHYQTRTRDPPRRRVSAGTPGSGAFVREPCAAANGKDRWQSNPGSGTPWTGGACQSMAAPSLLTGLRSAARRVPCPSPFHHGGPRGAGGGHGSCGKSPLRMYAAD